MCTSLSSLSSLSSTMTHVAPLLCLIFTSSLLSWSAAGSSILCTWTKVLPNAEVHYSFLRSDPLQASPSLRLYHSAWSLERSLLRCAWSDDAEVIHNYFYACQERTHEFSDHPDENIDVESMLEEAEELCVSVAAPGVGEPQRADRQQKRPVRSVDGRTEAENHQGQAERSEVRTHLRVKRGFIVPGTLWCGSGNKAPSYADLGVFADTDSCCREHDQCKHTILSFHSQFGVFNSNIFTMSHCDCDNKFHSCLMEANDRISDVVGYTFFNLLKMHCFELSHQLQCTERNWFGMCKETKMAPYAEVHPPTQYDSPNPTEVSVNSSVINATAPTEMLVTSDSTSAAASTLTTPSTSSQSASVAPVTNITTVTNVTTSTSEGDDLENTLPSKKQTLSGLDVTEKQLSCDVYKDLDKCRKKILPKQKKYGLYNPETRTQYHCNCTSRLFQNLAKQGQLTEVQSILMGHVSQSCFLPQDCPAGQICSSVLVRAELPQEDQSSRADMEEHRHLQAIELKVRRPNVRRAKRKDRAVRLHKLCLRMVRPKLNQNQTRTQGQDARGSAVRGSEMV
ncbi:group 3 secretory phospholipase A2 [Anoplopoma fimbria]|uniref:group 3 secretory phospholipase A2 n=1 Tax=Anoplopoma fimbria TaxID=229290 RepID=UPI0023EDE95A|nr:group 3 secretory phospholipase A2 [Anoplopoma fimbria]